MNFVIFHTVQYTVFTTVGIGSKITVFCLRFDQHAKDSLSRVRSGSLFSASLRAYEIACSAPPSSTMTGDFCFVSVQSDEKTSNWPSQARSDSDNGRNETEGFFFVPATTSICVVALPQKHFTAC